VDFYRLGIRPLLFSGLKLDPEMLHQQSLHWLSRLNANQQRWHWLLSQLEQNFQVTDARLQQNLWNLSFPNPFGLAAGFDKNGVAAGIWDRFGFGFAELGTVTYHPQPGNPRPRLFRLVEDEAVLNRMGFNNEGSAALQACLEVNQSQIPLGANLGKSKITPLETAAEDYLGSFQRLKGLGDYFVVNVSSPNTPGLRSLQNVDSLSLILDALGDANDLNQPILVKIAPDLETDAIRDVIQLAQGYNLAGIIATNTTIRRDMLKTKVITATGNPVTEEAGGISGKPVRDRATEVIRLIYQETNGQLPIVGVGGIFTAEDAWEKITAGASLVQVYTGWIYEGPGMAKRVLTGLLQKLEQHGLNSIAEAVGLEYR
jgi:dihydroorotate dehydrogenase